MRGTARASSCAGSATASGAATGAGTAIAKVARREAVMILMNCILTDLS